MALSYAMVARGAVVLVEYGGAATNAAAIARQVLDQIPEGTGDSNLTYTQDHYVFHVKRADGITVLCMADAAADVALRRIAFAFLEDVHGRFIKKYGRTAITAPAYAMNEEFSRILSQQMDYFSHDPNADSMNRIKVELNQVRNVMLDNIDKVLERGERLEVLVDQTANMQGRATRFKKRAHRFRNTMWWRNFTLMVLLIVLLLVMIYIVIAFVCHGITLPSCFR